MNLILSSDFPASPSPRIVDAIRAAASPPRIAWIPSHTDVTGAAFREAQRQFGALGLTDLELLDVDEDRDEVQIAYLHEYDVVYLTGDDAPRFRFNANRSGLSGRLRQAIMAGRLVVASGAGALLLTPNVSVLRLQDEPLEQVLATRGRFEALGAVPYEVLPHLEQRDAAFLDRVRTYSTRIPHDVVAMAAAAAIFHGPGEADTVGRIARYRNGNIIEP